jgi:hypothetical protein
MRWPFTSPCRSIFSAGGDTRFGVVVVAVRIEALNVVAMVVDVGGVVLDRRWAKRDSLAGWLTFGDNLGNYTLYGPQHPK